ASTRTYERRGGRFEPAERRRRLSGASALESLSRKGLRRSQAVAAAPQNDPKKPGITPQNRDRSRSRGAGRPTPPGGIVPAATRALVAALLLSTASLVGAQTHLAPDGTWVGGGTPQLAPNGTWVGGRPELAPNGAWVGGSPELAPNGRWIGGGRPE